MQKPQSIFTALKLIKSLRIKKKKKKKKEEDSLKS